MRPQWNYVTKNAPISRGIFSLNDSQKNDTIISMSSGTDIRLPTNVIPKFYDLFLMLDLESCTLKGKAVIDVVIKEATPVITIHAEALAIRSAECVFGNESVSARAFGTDFAREGLMIHFPKILPAGEAKFIIEFEGGINDQMAGCYQSVYTHNGVTKIMATTQFEAVDARRAFPCWDEPSLKARFRLTLDIPQNRTAVSNMPVVAQTLRDSRKIVEFDVTPVMSTYLVAFVVGEFEYLEEKTKRGIPVRIFTTPGKSRYCRFALDTAVRMLEFYEEYFEVPYPLPKLDMVAIPDFAVAAMENWGLITYREVELLTEESRSSESARQRIAIVIAHELAHQWFGNLVTMEWWTQLWLNEGFAAFMEYFTPNELFPEWHLRDYFLTSRFAPALASDSLRTTHPIEVPIGHPDEIEEVFDHISYAKGASVLRMIEHWLGQEHFRRGLHLYFERHTYGNATTDDLWRAFEDASGKPVKAVMDTWTKQPGYPLITLSPEGHKGIWRYKQERFLKSGLPLEPDEEQQTWQIGLRVGVETKNEKTELPALVDKKEGHLRIPPDAVQFKLNAGHTAFVRIQYPLEQLRDFYGGIREKTIAGVDRFGLLNDTAALVKAGRIPTDELLSMLEEYRNETEYLVWTELLAALAGISSLLPDSGAVRDDFNCFARRMLSAAVSQKGWDAKGDETHLEIMLRPRLLFACGRYGDTATLRKARRRFEEFLHDPQTIDPNLYGAVFGLTAWGGGTAEYDLLADAYRNEEHPEIKMRLLASLGMFPQKELIEKALHYALSDKVRAQDFTYVMHSILTKRGHECAWDFLKQEWDAVLRRYGGNMKMMVHILDGALEVFDNEERAEEIEQFFVDNPVPNARRTILQSLETIRIRAAWRERDYNAIAAWLKKKRREAHQNVRTE